MGSASTETVNVVTEDAHEMSLTIFPNHGETAPVILCFPAMGVAASYYGSFAQKLCDGGYHVVWVDLRGHGQSSLRPSRRIDFGYREMIHQDYSTVVATVRQRFPQNSIYLLGHSLGGQLACLFASLQTMKLDGLILICSCSVYRVNWPWRMRLGLTYLCLMARLVPAFLGYFPGQRIGFGGREARGVMRDWSQQGWTGRYSIKGDDVNYEERLSQLVMPILALSFADDTYAPMAAVEHLLGKMGKANVQHMHIEPGRWEVEKFGHFAWRKQGDAVVYEIGRWFSQRNQTVDL